MSTAQIKAGFGKGELLFPPELFPLEGFQGIHDIPCIRLMILSTGAVRMAIASVELVNLPPKGVDLCKEIIKKRTKTPKEHIWIHVTHAISTMHEPGPMGPPEHRRQETEREREQKQFFFSAIEQAVLAAAEEAVRSFGPAKIGWGIGQCSANRNRDLETAFGWWTGINAKEPSNKQMSVFQVQSLDGTIKGFLISYGIKPCALDNSGMETGTRLVSADICGVCSRIMEKQFGVPALFCVSAAGDQVPQKMALLDHVVPPGTVHSHDYGVKYGLKIVSKIGTLLGLTAISIAKETLCTTSNAMIQFSGFSFPWPIRANQPLSPSRSVPEEAFSAIGEQQIEVHICILGDTAFIAEKPEINVRTELELWKSSPFAHTILLCMVNGGMKYMPDRLAYERNTFEAQKSFLLPGAAEHFVSETAKELNKLYSEETL